MTKFMVIPNYSEPSVTKNILINLYIIRCINVLAIKKMSYINLYCFTKEVFLVTFM